MSMCNCSTYRETHLETCSVLLDPSLGFSCLQALPSHWAWNFFSRILSVKWDSARPIGSVRPVSIYDLKDSAKVFVSLKLFLFCQSTPKIFPPNSLNNISAFWLKSQVKIKSILFRNGGEYCLALANLIQA